MTELYKTYIESAEKLTSRINDISESIATEKNADKLYDLKTRRRLLAEERYDLLEIAHSLKTGSIWGDFY